MALSNREQVGRVIEILKTGLAPYILREYKQVYRGDYLNEIDRSIAGYAFELPREALENEQTLKKHLDLQGLLKLMIANWREVFQSKLGHIGRSYVGELMTARNDWAHQKAFSIDEAYRVADTAARLLQMVNAVDAAASVNAVARKLLHQRFDAEAKKAKKMTGTHAKPPEQTTPIGLKPWRDIVQPHPDVASGRYIQAEFAADLSQVLAGTAEPEYQDAQEFFRRTYLTEGLLELLVTGVRRLTGRGGDPVVQLQTSFGGGKTHSMLALYHLAKGKVKLADIPGGDRIVAQIDNDDLPEANIAVLVGTALDVAKPREYPDATVNTLWGEMAYQLGGAEGYRIVEAADKTGTSPGSNTLKELFFRFGPCLIIIDELVAYARNIYGVSGLPAGSFESVMTFMQALTEAVKASDEALLLVSIPESDIEIGGQNGVEVLERLSHTIGRVESVWKPVTATESFEIVRRRLFSSQMDFAARDAVINAFGDMYRNASGEFPSGVAERDYLDRLRAAYPIHPELFDRLYQDWSTLERFQRTRGVLRLMAAVIHQLWVQGDPSLLIMPGTLPLFTAPVRNELLRYLPDTWAAVYETDVDGEQSRPFTIDGDVPALGRYRACRRVARTIFIGSAPSVAGQGVRGLEEVRIRLGCAQPGEPSAVFGDALRRMGGLLTYLYTDGSRYWYDTRPTVNKLARDRAQSWSATEVDAEIVARLRKVPKNKTFAAFHVAPATSADVTDDDRVRVVVLRPEYGHKRSGESSAVAQAQSILKQRGAAQRLYKNMLVFIAPDMGEIESLRQAVRELLAWQSIKDEQETLNLDAQQRRQVNSSLDKTDGTVNSRLLEAYSWLIVPEQPEPLGPIEMRTNRISGSDNFYERAARKLQNDGLLIVQWSPDILRMELDRFIWGEQKDWEVRLKQIWEYLAQYVYLPRLRDKEVLLNAVRDGVQRIDAPFAYATGKDKDGYHTGVIYRKLGQIYFDDTSLITHPEHISRRPEKQVSPVADEPVPSGDDSSAESQLHADTKIIPPAKRNPTRYYGRVSIDSQRVNREVGIIVEEIIEQLTAQIGCDVTITLEISAKKPDGFDEAIERTISENSRTLKFDNFSFEEV